MRPPSTDALRVVRNPLHHAPAWFRRDLHHIAAALAEVPPQPGEPDYAEAARRLREASLRRGRTGASAAEVRRLERGLVGSLFRALARA